MTEKKNSVLSRLTKKRKKILVKALILAGLLFGINTYAWFIYTDKFGGNINASVVAWDVMFFDQDDQINSITLEIDSLYPGMNEYKKEIVVDNKSDLDALFTYSIESMTLMGIEYKADATNTSTLMISNLENGFPFKIDFEQSATELAAKNGSAKFSIIVNWPFESTTNYFKINEYFDFQSNVIYYTKSGDDYVVDNDVNSSNINDKLETGLYVNSDAADTYWGKSAATYKELNPESPCLTLQLKLVVSQKQ